MPQAGTRWRRESRAGHFAQALVLILGMVAVATAGGESFGRVVIPAEYRETVVRVRVAEVPAFLRDRVCPCCTERDEGGPYAVLTLTDGELDDLHRAGVAHERLGPVIDHLVRHAPRNTLRAKPVPSLNMVRAILGIAPPDESVRRSPDPCVDPGVISLQPYDEYHTRAEGICFINNLAAAYPDLAVVTSIGTTHEARDIWALKISDNPELAEPGEEQILFTGITHAREWITHEMMLYLAEYLTTRYDSDPAVQHVVDHAVVWIVPVVNPDGFEYSWNGSRMWRKNRRPVGTDTYGVDINRNYEYRWGYDDLGSSGSPSGETYRGPYPASELETQALQALLTQEGFALAVSYHSYSQLFLHSWGYTPDVLPESYAPLRAIAKKYVDLVFGVHGQVYTPGQGAFTIYRTNGDFNDYGYGAQGVLTFTPELRPATFAEGGFLLPEDQIRPTVEENTAAALWLMLNVANGFDFVNPSGPLIPAPQVGSNPLALPVAGIAQKPPALFGYPEEAAPALTTWLDDSLHVPPYEGAWVSDFEGCAPGGAYWVQIDAAEGAVWDWAQAAEGYRALPYVFEDGVEIMLSNVEPGLNVLSVPGLDPVPMTSVTIARRITTSLTFLVNYGELILEERTALEDLNADDPWLDWAWSYQDADGAWQIAHPTGAGGATTLLEPGRVYYVQAKVPSFEFGSADEDEPTYFLRLPGFNALGFADCNRNGSDDTEDIAGGGSLDCNGNGVPDDCDLAETTSADCNDNGVPDECDIAAGVSEDCSGNGIPDECEPDCNGNEVADSCDIVAQTSADCSGNGIPDECEPDCNGNGAPDSCDIVDGLAVDCDQNEIPDSCQPGLYGRLNLLLSGSISYEFLYYLEQDGHQVTFLDPGEPFVDSLGAVHVLVLAGGSAGHGPAEQAQIDEFVAGGGGLIIFTAATDLYQGPAYPLASRSGWTLRAGAVVTQPEDALVFGLPESASLEGYGTQPVLKEGATVVMNWVDGTPMAVRYAYGNGRVVYFNDLWGAYRYRWKGDPEYGAALMRNALALLSPALPWDCNENGVHDLCDIASGTSADADANEVPDECELPGDLNCDRVLDLRDINPFVLALANPTAYESAFPDCGLWRADINGDGAADIYDLNPFVVLLVGGYE